jgi:hypothetical protein
MIQPRANVVKHFTSVLYEWANQVKVPGKAFQPSLMFPSKAGVYPSGAAQSVLTYFKLGWKSQLRTNPPVDMALVENYISKKVLSICTI